jgi:hypothetical protein
MRIAAANSTSPVMRADTKAFAKAVDKFITFALQMPRNSYLC